MPENKKTTRVEDLPYAMVDNYGGPPPKRKDIVVPGNSGDPDADIASLVKDLYGQTQPAQPAPKETVMEADPEDSISYRQPSIAAYLQAVQTRSDTVTKQPPYSESLDASKVQQSLEPAQLMKGKFINLSEKTPQERAKIGGQMGGAIGLAMNGMFGGLLGAGMGAMAARASGEIQSGQRQDSIRRGKTYEAMKAMGLASQEGRIEFDDGASFQLTDDPSIKLRNTSSMISKKKDRTTYEIDGSNPLSKRTATVAKPLAYFMNNGVMRWANAKNPRDKKSYESTLGTLVNALQTDASDINLVYARARQLTKKAGVSKQAMTDYFRSIKNTLDENELETIEKGIDILYA